MQCFEAGQVFILPVTNDLEALRYKLRDFEASSPFDIIYSIEDILRYYHVDAGNLTKYLGAYPFVVRVPEGQELEYAIRYRQYSDDIRVAIPNFNVRPLAADLTINEDMISQAIELAHVASASREDCGKDVRVTVIDTGVDPDLLPYPQQLQPVQYATDVPNLNTPGQLPSDPIGHGSLVAHIINRIAPAATIQSIKMMEQGGNIGGLVAALYLAEAEFKPDIYNLSLAVTCDLGICGSCGSPQQPEALVNEAQLQLLFKLLDGRTIVSGQTPLIVASAGNNARQILMPARFPNVLAVGSYDMSANTTARYSHYDSVAKERFILAPGGLDDIQNCVGRTPNKWNRARLENMFGTSFSAAFVTGVAARYLCATKNSPCSRRGPGGNGVVSTRNFLMECLKRSATPIAPPGAAGSERDGLGLVSYDRFIACDVAAETFA